MAVTDEQLIIQCAEGDERAFDELYNRYKDKLFGFILQYVKNHQKAEDILQETFVRAFKNAGKFLGNKKFKTWIYAIAVNLCRDEIRHRKRRKNNVSLETKIRSRTHQGTELELKDTIKSEDKGPSEILHDSELNQRLEQAIARLPDMHRLVLELSMRHGFNYREIAKIVKCSLGTVQSRMYRTVELLKEDFENQGLI